MLRSCQIYCHAVYLHLCFKEKYQRTNRAKQWHIHHSFSTNQIFMLSYELVFWVIDYQKEIIVEDELYILRWHEILYQPVYSSLVWHMLIKGKVRADHILRKSFFSPNLPKSYRICQKAAKWIKLLKETRENIFEN